MLWLFLVSVSARLMPYKISPISALDYHLIFHKDEGLILANTSIREAENKEKEDSFHLENQATFFTLGSHSICNEGTESIVPCTPKKESNGDLLTVRVENIARRVAFKSLNGECLTVSSRRDAADPEGIKAKFYMAECDRKLWSEGGIKVVTYRTKYGEIREVKTTQIFSLGKFKKDQNTDQDLFISGTAKRIMQGHPMSS